MEISKREQSIFGIYNILRVTEGGMARIYYLQEKAPSQRRFIAKTIRPNLLTDVRAYRRFIDEAKLHLVLPPHPLVAKAVMFDIEPNPPYLLIEWIDGLDLDEWSQQGRKSLNLPQFTSRHERNQWFADFWGRVLKNQQPYHPASLLFYMFQVCIALSWLYEHGVKAHGDIHNKNIMINNNDSRAIIIDLGLSSADDFIINNLIDISGSTAGRRGVEDLTHPSAWIC